MGKATVKEGIVGQQLRHNESLRAIKTDMEAAVGKRKPIECECTDWTMVGHPSTAYGPSWHDGSPWPTSHHPDCHYYTPPGDG